MFEWVLNTPLYYLDTFLKKLILLLVSKLTKSPVHSEEISKISYILVSSNFSNILIDVTPNCLRRSMTPNTVSFATQKLSF